MQRILKNGSGKTFKSKSIKNSDWRDQMFLYKQNFLIISKEKQKKEKSLQKAYSSKSKSSKINYYYWKNGLYEYSKLRDNLLSKLELILIRKSILILETNNEDFFKKFLDKDSENKMLSFKKISDKKIKEISFLAKNNVKKTIKTSSKKSSFIKSEFINNVKDLKSDLLKNFQLIKSIFLNLPVNKVSIIGNKDIRQKILISNKDLYNKKKEIKKDLHSNIKKDFKEFTGLKSINILDKIKFNPIVHSYIYHKNILLLDEYTKNKDLSYDCEYKHKKAIINIAQSKTLLETKKRYSSKINDMINNFVFDKKSHDVEKILFKEEYKKQKLLSKNQWSDVYKELKAGSASNRAIKIERQKIFKTLYVKKSELKISLIKKSKFKNSLSVLRNEAKQDIKYKNKIRNNELRDNIMSVPVEMEKHRYWIGILLGFIFPGLGSFNARKYTKGIFHSISSIFVFVIIGWIFGAFPSKNGNGLLGLLSLGSDPSTQSNIVIGTTNGQPNDGRFYLVMGALGIILLAFIIMYWFISVFDNINQHNLSRLGVRSSNWKEQKKILKSSGLPYLLSLPAIIFVTFIVVLPLLSTVLISFTNFGQSTWSQQEKTFIVHNGDTSPIKWVGLGQFKLIFKVMGPEFKDVFIWTLIWTFGSTITLISIGTLFALIVNQNRIIFKTFFRTIYILPWAVPAFITIMFFSIFFKHDGIFNQTFHISTDWSSAGSKTKFLMILMQGWLGHSYIFLLVTGMLQSIPKSLYEAARIDGSSSLRQFRTITAPIIISQIAPLLIGQFTFNFNNFGLIYLFNQGGPVQSGKTAGEQDIFISWIYKLINSGNDNRPGAAAAMSLIISIFTVTPSAFLFIRSKSFRKEL